MILRIDPDHMVTTEPDDVEESTLQAWYDEGCVILRLLISPYDGQLEEIQDWIGSSDSSDPKQIPIGWTRVRVYGIRSLIRWWTMVEEEVA